MHVYRVIQDQSTRAHAYHSTMADAHADAKMRGAALYPMLRIELFDIPTDKMAILRLLNSETPDECGLNPIRTWAITSRGGLLEVANGE